MYQHLLSPLTLRGTTLKNRVVFAPTTMGLPPEQRAERLMSIARLVEQLHSCGAKVAASSLHPAMIPRALSV